MFSCFGSGPFGESEEGNEPSPQTIIHTHLNTIPGFTGGGAIPSPPLSIVLVTHVGALSGE